MKLCRPVVAVSLILAAACPAVFAGPGTTGAQFLKIDPSARSAGIAGSYAGVADDAFAVYANPAGLARLEKTEFDATYLNYFGGVDFGYLGYAAPLKNGGVLGFGYTYLTVGDMEKRALTEDLLGTFSARDISLTAAYGVKDAAPSVLEGLDLGASVKLISSEIDQTVAYSAAADLAASYHAAENLDTALVVQNIGTGVKFRETTDPLPLNLKVGAGYRPAESLLLAGEIDEYLIDSTFYASAGTEYSPVKQLALRAGYRFGYRTDTLGGYTGLSLGIGFRIWSAGLDYAFVPFGDLGDTHRFTFSMKF